MNFNKLRIALIIVAILANSIGMFFPVLGSTFSPYYASIAKHIALSNNWIDLMLSGHDWLDKPHFPFWVTAVSFKIFGINSFAYILPGFIFNLIGAFYTYKLAKILYDDNVALLSTLLYLTTLHLMLSAIDIRAEAYLLGEIIPACYYFLLFDQHKTFRTFILGAFFSALALMTKGMFVLVTICSGLICLWLYERRFRNFLDWHWYMAIIVSVLFTAPEILSLYMQFDMHPDKVVFGMTHVSGVRWFFWDSQFGRFFNTGPILTTNPMPYHWLFFVHTFLWAFLPWWPIFFCALWSIIRKRTISQNANIYLIGSFFITFIMFSATSFQVDHYTNIIFPFACIMCAKWLDLNLFKHNKKIKWVSYIESFISILFLSVAFAISCILFTGTPRVLLIAFVAIVSVILIIIYILFHIQPPCLLPSSSLTGRARRRLSPPWDTRVWDLNLFEYMKCRESPIITYPVITISTLFIVIMCVNGILYAKYDAGYNIAQELNKNVIGTVVGYKMSDDSLKGLEFYTKNNYIYSDNLNTLKPDNKTFYVVTPKEDMKEVHAKFNNSQLYMTFKGCPIGTFAANAINKNKLAQQLNTYVVLQVN